LKRPCSICGKDFELSSPASRQKSHKQCKRRLQQRRYYENNFRSLHVPELFRPVTASPRDSLEATAK
jgi:hypothetical protein